MLDHKQSRIYVGKFTNLQKNIFCFIECKLNLISICTTKHQSKLHDSLGPRDIFLGKLALIPQISCDASRGVVEENRAKCCGFRPTNAVLRNIFLN